MPNNSFPQTIAETGRADQTVNKSRFIGEAMYCANEREVGVFLRRFASEHPHAHHLAFAYQLKTGEGIAQRMHDAGEPSGTAGRPIMQHIEGKRLMNTCVAVIRYYGGINLGTGGLARAYGNTARVAIEAAKLIPFVEMCELELAFDYSRLDQLSRDLAKVKGRLLDKKFDQRVTVVISLPVSEAAGFQQKYK